MELVDNCKVDVASYITAIKCEEYKFLCDAYLDAVLDESRQMYLYLERDYFDQSDLA
ncbi:hypothetical protein [Enterococcus faecalis]|uniref:Uncharacterized protein n=1 Tax=Enterococcus faecalis RP2S-4 TaxID=1244145 RepID=A0ABC9TNA8_ENTFL|nr:hypothetical protein [Enterococcus faecalis]EPI11682.1 hypothetical protein D358_00214 [Enterococcus faecalis RP2S-4]